MPATSTDNAQPDCPEQSKASPPEQPQYRSDIDKGKNPNTEPRARHTRVWVELGKPPTWTECEVSAVRDKPKVRGLKQYQLISTEPQGLDVGGGDWFEQEDLWDWDDILKRGKQTKR